MNDLKKMLEEKLNYLYEMQKKYHKLNEITMNEYDWRERAINEQIGVLEELKNESISKEWDECYKEDLKEAGF